MEKQLNCGETTVERRRNTVRQQAYPSFESLLRLCCKGAKAGYATTEIMTPSGGTASVPTYHRGALRRTALASGNSTNQDGTAKKESDQEKGTLSWDL